jgi:hypothetical protein
MIKYIYLAMCIYAKQLYMNLETRRPRGRPRDRWQDEVMEDGRMVG